MTRSSRRSCPTSPQWSESFKCLVFIIQGSGFRLESSEFRVEGSGLRVEDSRVMKKVCDKKLEEILPHLSAMVSTFFFFITLNYRVE